MELKLENIELFSLPLDNENIQQLFTDENEMTSSEEHKDQIFMFKDEASKFLWDYEHKILRLGAKPKYYKTITTFDTNKKTVSEIKKYLFNLEIPFQNWVFFAEKPHLGFMLTWNMIIKPKLRISKYKRIIKLF